MKAPAMKVSVGHVIAAFLERCGVRAAFGVISIHNMPILDAIATRGAIRFVSARGEAGAASMADACARTTGALGVVITSTGTAAGNAAGGMVEALTAGTPLLHITGQIEVPYLDRDLAYIHEAPDQLAMLKAVSKQAWRVRTPETALATFKAAVRAALTAPSGPVSVEVPIDIQGALIDMPADLDPLPVPLPLPDARAIARLADALAAARRPLLWLGGGTRHAGAAVARLAAMGIGVVTTTQGRAVLPETHALSLGAYTMAPPVEAFYATCDALVVVGSRLRGNETLKYQLKLPRPLYRIDANPAADGRGYANEQFVCGDAAAALAALADRLEGRLRVDPAFAADLAAARAKAVAALHDGLGPYSALVAAVQQAGGARFNWVRDVTLSNSIWGNRELRLADPRAGVHALGGGIGLGLPMAIGAAIGAAAHGTGCATLLLAGDGGFVLNLGELACAVQEQADFTVILMNDRSYGVIKNIQDAHYGGRRVYADLHTPDFAALARALGFAHRRVGRIADAGAALAALAATSGPKMLEVDMTEVGDFKTAFAGPPVRTKATA
ncbi:MAG: thiamine pyrophosphate-binding protein [Burkholderiales bacterium]|nr:thiamine pyrophosphate-binding protein [Burkholderiales bacterium]